MRTKITTTLFLIILLASSCLESIDPYQDTFDKYYGTNVDSKPDFLHKTQDGGYLLMGRMSHNIQESPGAVNDVLTIIKTDALGIERWTRAYKFDTLTFENNIYIRGTTWDIQQIIPHSAVELRNGDIFIVAISNIVPRGFNVENGFYGAPSYLLIDKNGNIQDYDLLVDNIEDPSYLSDPLARYRPDVYMFPDSEDLLITYRYCYPLSASLSRLFNTAHYALSRINPYNPKEPIWTVDVAEFLPEIRRIYDISFDSNDNIVAVGWNRQFNDPCAQIFIQTIDKNSGVVLTDRKITAQSELHIALGVVSTDEGFAILDYSTVENACRFIEEGQSVNTDIGSIYYLDNQFNIDAIVQITAPELGGGVRYGSFKPTRDGGFLAALITTTSGEGLEGSILVKVDHERKTSWTYRLPNQSIVSGIHEDTDGGIAFMAYSGLAGASSLWNLRKINSDGTF